MAQILVSAARLHFGNGSTASVLLLGMSESPRAGAALLLRQTAVDGCFGHQ
jgi:hypothetical protein